MDLSQSRYAWGWELPSVPIEDNKYINWKFDKVLEPVYDFSNNFGKFGSQGPVINYNYNDWNWGNWNWLNDVQAPK